MRFVWVAKEVPLNPESGLLIYSNGLLRGVLESGATGTLIAFARKEAEGVSVPGLEIKALRPQRRIRALSLLSSQHSDSYRHQNSEFKKVLEQAVMDKPDVVVIDYFAMGWVLPVIERALKNQAKRPMVIHISHNYESNLRFEVAASVKNPIMRRILRIDANKAAKLEKKLLAACDLLVVITDQDKRCFERDAPEKPIITLTPAYDGEIAPTRPIDSTLPRRVIILGSFDWIAKQSNLRRFLKAAENAFPAAGIDILVVGRGPESFIEELSFMYPWCKFTGRVADVRQYLSGGRIGVMPDDVGGGFKLKYLYYIFAGLPVATIRSQVAGMPIDVDRDFISRGSMEDLVSAIVETVDDIPLLEGMRQRAWNACAPEFNWGERGRRLRQCIDDLMKAR